MINAEILQDIYTDHDLCGTQRRELVKVIAMIKQNRLIELPCAVGDTVYVIDYEYEDIYISSSKYYYVEARDFDYEMLHWMGEWCFLTKEEAEAKLKELENEQKENNKG